MLGDSWWAELKRLSVRIMDKQRKHMGSGVLYKHDEQNVFVLTAAHVVNGFAKDEEFLVECQPDKGEEHGEMRDKYTFCVKGAAVRSYYEPKTFPPKTYHENDAAVIKLDVRGRDWIANRKEAKFPPAGLPLLGKPVAGYGYPKGKSRAKGSEEEIISSASEPTQNAFCENYTDSNHRVEWNLGISVSDPYSDDETAGWSGCTLFLTDTEPMVMAGSAFAIYTGYKFAKFRGADMHYYRELLQTKFSVTANECTYSELNCAEVVSGGTRGGLVPSQYPSDFWIHGSRKQFINKLLSEISINNPLVLYGPAGCGKSEVARAIARKHPLGGTPYTIPYRVSKDEENMKATILALEIDGEAFVGGSAKDRTDAFIERLGSLTTKDISGREDNKPKWLIIDDMYDPEHTFEELKKEQSFQELQKLNNHLICTTRYAFRESDPHYRIPCIFKRFDNDEQQKEIELRERSALREHMCEKADNTGIAKEDFDEFCELTGANLLLADWTARTLVTGFADMKDVLHTLRTGSLPEPNGLPEITDERTGNDAPLNVHISKLYDMDNMPSGDKKILALLQFLGKIGIEAKELMALMPDKIKEVDKLRKRGWIRVEGKCYNMDPVLKLACRCKGLSPEQHELKELLSKMHSIYLDRETREHCSWIRAYYKAAKEVVPALFDNEMQQWHSKICGV